MFNKDIISLEEHFAFVESLLSDNTSGHFLSVKMENSLVWLT